MSRLCECFRYMCGQKRQRRNEIIHKNAIESNPQAKVYAKDSMDRYGDDLCQLLLSYMKVEDRFRFEGVSKQWQRLIYETIDEIVIDDQMVSKMIATERAKYEMFCVKPNGKPFMTSMFKKCPNISSIDIRCDQNTTRIIFKLMAKLKTNYPYLREIQFKNHKLDPVLADWVFPKFGPIITEMDITGECDHIKYINECPKLTTISCYMSKMFSPDNQLLVKNLKHLGIYYDISISDQRLSTFIDYNMSLRTVKITIDGTIESTHDVRIIMAQLSRFNQLLHLEIFINQMHSLEYSLYDSLKTIGQMCRQLKAFLFHCKHYSEYRTEILKSIQFMPHLKSFGFGSHLIPITESKGMFESMKGWPKLNRLQLYLCDFNYQLFQQIETNLPKLQRLAIRDPKGRINNIWLERLATLSHLKMLSIIHTTENLRYMTSGLETIIRKCHNLRTIHITNSNEEFVYEYSYY